ncbi:BREX-1 system adenine-specific DNA-methyltransferase PglX [Alcaligenes sp.]|uniref:BREX-1 system adenine-specific DNA-methyltransferase PglX n=1 Tax=Alcaligenes sp. TaxID=512 RepID=UPI003CFFB5A5
MDTSKLKKFAQFARTSLMEQVGLKLDTVLAADSLARRESAEAVRALEKAIADNSREHVIERVAYIWFNRFCALRFMDVNRYTRVGIVSPTEGQFQPEILAEAKMGHIDEDMVPASVRQEIQALLSGRSPSRDPQGEAYRLLVVAACRDWHRNMPFLFQPIDDYTELLLPDDLLSENSILAYTREAMTPDACESVEVIGWLYQFYISEKKDHIFDGLKKNKKITPENIPAATQLFTPHWIVRYLVENSLGRLWLLNRPSSKLVEKMDYYIKPKQAETDFLRIKNPEEIKICDPACGSGHMLTYAFDLLYMIYEEEGYDSAEIPEKILTNNLYGIELDERAGELAAFALTMKARERQRRFFNKGIRPNICVLENVHFDEGELKSYMDFVGRDLFTAPLQTTLRQFEEADNFGSLIRPDVTDVDGMLRILESQNVSGQLFISMTHQKALQALRQADYLSPKYHVVIANPPYMGSKGMNGRLGAWLKQFYPNSCSDLMTSFMERNQSLTIKNGYWSLINFSTWMFLSSYERLRYSLLTGNSILSLVHLGRGIFGSDFGTVAFCVKNSPPASNTTGTYRKLFEEHVQVRTVDTIERLFLDETYGWYYIQQNTLLEIPGQPISYWLSPQILDLFKTNKNLGEVAPPKHGMSTGNNARFLKYWFEVDISKCHFNAGSKKECIESKKKWFPYNKGGAFRKWYGNRDLLINYQFFGQDIKAGYIDGSNSGARILNENYFFKENITWADVTAGPSSFRYTPHGSIFDGRGSCLFSESYLYNILGILNSKAAKGILSALNPTFVTTIGDLGKLPIVDAQNEQLIERAVKITQNDWDSLEVSWDFTTLPLLNPDYEWCQPTLKANYQKLHAHWREVTLETQRLEEENNRIFIEAYGLQDELTPEVPLKEITLTCNPHYRYGGDKTEEELEALLLADTMREFISYAVGCMFGRYSLDKPGLILANQGETLADYLAQVPEPTFTPDKDNVIPMLDGDWFADDITERFRRVLRVTFGDEHYEENLRFIEEALNIKGKRNYSLRDYFLSEFYTDHLKRYKKRPIYWLFSSPKGSFNALIYMHRYRPDTVSVVLNDYLREFRAKLLARKNHQEALGISASTSQSDKTKALKEIEKISKMIAEVDAYERDTLYPLATEQIEIDLDDGVKANYPKFGAALKKIPGLEAKDD